MHWIKLRSAKYWNGVHGSKDHVWGQPYFARTVKDTADFSAIMNYIDNNPVKSGLVASPEEWKASGAYYKANNISGLVDLSPNSRSPYIKLLA
jgi:hypothetical protein